jgi:ankyrin repeat protein
VRAGFNQIHLTITVSPFGDVMDVTPGGGDDVLKFWPQVQGEVKAWKFTPFEKNGKAVTAEIEEYLDLVPPERLPKKHVPPPPLRPTSAIVITLERTGCFGSCPSYRVTLANERIEFDGHGYVAASGRHTEFVDPNDVRNLAARFIAADFYSMDPVYRAAVTDSPTYTLSISIDGKEMRVVDYVGEWERMPAVISELENEVDKLAGTDRWISGGEGLVASLRSEGFRFRSFEAQVLLKQAAMRGRVGTVRDLIAAGVPLRPLPGPLPKNEYESPAFQNVGWLNAASAHADVLRLLIEAGASKDDQNDKDLALAGAARSGKVDAVQMLLAYGADPNADLSRLTVETIGLGMSFGEEGAASILIYAAESGNPEMVSEILRYRPLLEARDSKGRTAMFAAVEYRNSDEDGARVECIRLLAGAGANVNARDDEGNTPLHETFLTDVEEELLKLGADVNARNDEGETPIFTTVDNEAIPLFISHGADLTIRNKKGETVLDAAKQKGPMRIEALRKALEELAKRSPQP